MSGTQSHILDPTEQLPAEEDGYLMIPHPYTTNPQIVGDLPAALKNGRLRRLFATSNGGFMPMPSISASPVCTPTTSLSVKEVTSGRNLSPSDESLGFTTAPNSPLSSSRASPEPPKWTLTPPLQSPSPKLVRRSVTCRTTFPASNSLSPSSTSPVEFVSYRGIPSSSMPPERFLQRRASESDIHSHGRTDVEGSQSSVNITREAFTASPVSASEPHEATENKSPRASQASERKNDLRRHYALLELLASEVSYLMDLRVLVYAYLQNLQTITYRTPSSSAFSRASSFSSLSRSNGAALSSTTNLCDTIGGLQPMTSMGSKEKGSRKLFSEVELQLLSRNAEEILNFHERFVEELRLALAPLNIPMNADESDFANKEGLVDTSHTDEAIAIVAAKFATESSRFDLYSSFCAGHSEALNIVHRVQHSNTVTWDTFEQQSAWLAYTMFDQDAGKAVPSQDGSEDSSSSAPLTMARKRSVSLSAVDKRTRPDLPRATTTAQVTNLPSPDRPSGRLSFLDFLIKPVQRICRYPLLLEQLLVGRPPKATSNSFTTDPRAVDVDVVIRSATQAMRHAAGRVDEARHRHDIALQSSLIACRIAVPTLPQNFASSDAGGQASVLTSNFISSLGACLLAGSLDVVDHLTSRSTSHTATAKYLGAFLYLGGYLILAKVKGRLYEPRHWFRLQDFDVVDAGGEDALLPHSVQLTNGTHGFELAASCEQEKNAWLSAIEVALRHQSPHWINEPVSSLELRNEIARSGADVTEGYGSEQKISPAVASLLQVDAANNSKSEPPAHIPYNRRGPATSVRGIFIPSGNADTIIVRRSTALARMQVDHGLQDVMSEPCLLARTYAVSKEEELFQGPRSSMAGKRSRSGTGIMTKNRLRKHESVRVPRRRATTDVPAEQVQDVSSSAFRTLSLSKAAKRPKALSLTAVLQHDTESTSASLGSQASTHNSLDLPPSRASSSSEASSSQHQMVAKGREESPKRGPSRSSSLVRNLKGLFSSSRSSLRLSETHESTEKEESAPKKTQDILRRWVKPQSMNTAQKSRYNLAREQQSDLPPRITVELEFGGPLTMCLGEPETKPTTP